MNTWQGMTENASALHVLVAQIQGISQGTIEQVEASIPPRSPLYWGGLQWAALAPPPHCFWSCTTQSTHGSLYMPSWRKYAHHRTTGASHLATQILR